jgi:formyl-CoA transferase
MAGSLDGIRVIELATTITGPLAGMVLGDFGADVIKIENPRGGDPFRNFRGGTYSPSFCSYNRNKRSIALDLQTPLGKRVLEQLARRSDVLLTNFRTGALDRLGFSDGRLQEINPKLVRCYITGFGRSGPYAERPCYDAVGQAISGMSSLYLSADNPQITGPTISDNATGYSACHGILAALFERERTGKARRIEVNMLDATLAFAPDAFHYWHQGGVATDRFRRVRSSQSYSFRCEDDRLLCIHLSSIQKFWDGFVEGLGSEELRSSPRLATRALRMEHYFEIQQIAGDIIARKPRQHWERVFANLDVPFAPIYNIEDVAGDPQVTHLQSFQELRHPTEGPVTGIRRPVWIDGSRDDQPANAPPTLGEHTEEILHELAEVSHK